MEYCEDCNITYDGEPSNYCHECGKRLAPGGSPPETGSRTRGAGSKPVDPLTTTSELPFADQAESLARWKYRAEQAEALLEQIEEWNEAESPTVFDKHYSKALGLLRNRYEKAEIASLIAHLLRGNGAPSDRSGDERCPACGAKAVFVTKEGRDECMMCGHQWTPGVGVERSGSANDQAMP